MITLSKLSDDLVGLIFEKCEDFCAIFLALCNKRFYNLACALKIDLRYRLRYILKHDSVAADMLVSRTTIHGLNIEAIFRGHNKKKGGCECDIGKFCKDCIWAEIIERWCRENNLEMLSRINISSLSYDLLFQFPADMLVQYGWETIDTYSKRVLSSRMGFIRNYLVVCFRLRGAEFTKNIIQKHKLWKFAGYIDKELANLVIENFDGFYLHTFKQCTLINKQDYLKKFSNYRPEWEWAFRDIADVEKDLHHGSITEKIAAFLHFDRIDCILLCLRKKVELTEELSRFLTKTDHEEILEVEVDARAMIHACILNSKYKNYPRWRAQYKEDLVLGGGEVFYIHQNMWKSDTPTELIVLAHREYPESIYISENYDAIMSFEVDSANAAYKMASRGMLKCLKRLIAQFGLTKDIFRMIMLAFASHPDQKFSHTFIDYMHEIVIQNGDLSMLTHVLGQAIVSHYVEMVELLLPIAKFKDYMAKIIVSNDDRILFRKCRKYSDKWAQFASKKPQTS